MLRPLALAFACLSAPCAKAAAISVKIDAADWAKIEVDISVDPQALEFGQVELGGRTFDQVHLDEGLNLEDAGLPDIPTLFRLVAVDPALYYTVEVSLDADYVFPNILLAPIQKDRPDRSVEPAFRINEELYRTDTEIGSETVMSLGQAGLAGVAVLPLQITPLHYNPAQRRLTVWTKVHATIRGETKDGSALAPHHSPRGLRAVTPFQGRQLANLVVNSPQILRGAHADAGARLLVLTTPDLDPVAARVAAAATKPGITAEILDVAPALDALTLKSQIQSKYDQGGLDSVLLLGDEAHLPLYKWGANDIWGDSFYSFLDGNDAYADIGIGRLPAASLAEAELFAAKLEAYKLGKAAQKNVLLVAHAEDYPGKYTANQEQIRAAANPRQLNFIPQYAGAGATNASLSAALNAGPALVVYRGHGSPVAWADWSADAQPFGIPELHALAPKSDKAAIYFDIACQNGALRGAARSFAEEALLAGTAAHPGAGAAGILASTGDSTSVVNDTYNRRLFEYMQQDAGADLGELNALANNRLVRDSRGIMPTNSMMYILFAHPLLAPALD